MSVMIEGSNAMTTVTISSALPSDAAAIAELTGQLGYDASPAEVTIRLSRILRKASERFVIAEADGRVVGWLHAVAVEYVDVDPFVLIAGLVVDRERRRQGIGRALLEDAEAWAMQRGCSLVRLTSSSSRTKAHRFYQELGYVNVKTQYSFVKPLNEAAAARLANLVPRVDP